MFIRPVFIIFLFHCPGFSYQATNSTYKAAVVEYSSTNDSLQDYLNIISDVDEQTDIIVFPEATLDGNYTLVPDVSTKTIPCNSTEEFENYLKELSCAAASRKIYLVVNLKEKMICTPESQALIGDKRPCSSSGYSLYNTNVAFDRSGTVVARYRKFNLFGEFELNTTLTSDLTTFTTDYNVTYGMFTCFDIQFETPALTLIRQNITNIIFPTMWFSEIPFLTALQVQQMFAQATNVNFLAAGANDPGRGSGGSGIYQGIHGPIVYDYLEVGGSKVHVAEVGNNSWNQQTEMSEMEIDRQGDAMSDFFLLRDQVDVYTSVMLNTSEKNTVETLCHYADNKVDKLCCNFKITLSRNNSAQISENYYRYRLVAYSGVRTFSGLYNGGVEVCGVIACLNDTLESCAYRFLDYKSTSWPVIFEYVQIKGNFTKVHTRQQYPSSLLSNIRPIAPSATEWVTTDFNETLERSYSLRKSQSRLLTFAIYGRDFARDSDPFVQSSAEWIVTNFCTTITFIMILHLF